MKKLLTVVLLGSLIFTVAGCKKKEEKPQLPPGHPSTEGGMPQTKLKKVEGPVAQLMTSTQAELDY